MTNKSYMPSKADITRNWHFIDAEGQILGKLATKAANILMGKTKAIFTPNTDTGDKVVVTNAAKIAVTGNKLTDKRYYWHTGYPKGIRSKTLGEKLEGDPKKVIEAAVRGMLPKNRLRAKRMINLYVYSGAEHPHTAQLQKETK